MSEVINMQTMHYYIVDKNVVNKIGNDDDKNEKYKEIINILLKMYLKDIDKKREEELE